MPHLILEYSSNLFEKDKLPGLFAELHEVLVETLSAKLDVCKSRARECQLFRMGNGDSKNAFIHMTLKIRAGRSPEALQLAAERLLEALKCTFVKSSKELQLQMTLEISDLSEFYFSSDV